MSNPLDLLVDKILSRLPKTPLMQTKFMYYLNTIIVITLVCFTISNFYSFAVTTSFSYLFGGLLTGVFALISLMSFQATRNAYRSLKDMEGKVQAAVNEIKPEEIHKQIMKEGGSYIG